MVPSELSAEERRRHFERTTSWASVQRKITPVSAARKLSRGHSRRSADLMGNLNSGLDVGSSRFFSSEEEEWIVQERLKVNFYLDDGEDEIYINNYYVCSYLTKQQIIYLLLPSKVCPSGTLCTRSPPASARAPSTSPPAEPTWTLPSSPSGWTTARGASPRSSTRATRSRSTWTTPRPVST